MSNEATERMKFWVQAGIGVFTGAMIPIALMLLHKLNSIEERLDDFNSRVVLLESWRGEGRRYTADDAEKDFGVFAKVLEQQGLKLDDHETRLRKVERVIPQ